MQKKAISLQLMVVMKRDKAKTSCSSSNIIWSYYYAFLFDSTG